MFIEEIFGCADRIGNAAGVSNAVLVGPGNGPNFSKAQEKWIQSSGPPRLSLPLGFCRGRGARVLLDGSLRFRFDGDFHFRPRVEAYFGSILINQGVLDADLAVQVITALHCDLGFVRFLRVWGRDDLLDNSRESSAGGAGI
jgi:hypothetical protein